MVDRLNKITDIPDRNTVIDNIIAFAKNVAGFAEEGTTADNRVKILSKDGLFWTFATSDFLRGTRWIRNIEIKICYTKPTSYSTMRSAPGSMNGTFWALWAFNGPYTSLQGFHTKGSLVFFLELIPGLYSAMSFGKIEKRGNWVGGEYISADGRGYTSGSNDNFPSSDPQDNFMFNNQYEYAGFIINTQIWPCSYGRGTMRFIRPGDVPANNFNDFNQFSRKEALTTDLSKRVVAGVTMQGNNWTKISTFSPNNFNARSTIYDINIIVYDWIKDNGEWLHVGRIPNLGITNNRFVDDEDYILNTWQVFPNGSKTGTPNAFLYNVFTNTGWAYNTIEES